ncbi:MAG TPA: hypothetical protein VD966_09675 [Pyrinomonadaceae bacterium]|nr:hypothetical protein [Pyrinomonadaceae bacterium]
MTSSKGKRTVIWTAIFALVITIALPTISLADTQGRGRGRGQDKKAEKFKNGHDARDGRWDGRGPRDRDDDFDRGRGRGRARDLDRDDDGIRDRTEVRRYALDAGYQEGYRAGEIDRANGERFNYNDEGAYRDATTGYRDSFGNLESYRRSFREGFRRGYDDGYRQHDSRRGGFGDILGNIFGLQ